MRQKEINPPDLEALRMRVIEGLTLQEIGDALGFTRERARQRLLKFGVKSEKRAILITDQALVAEYLPEWKRDENQAA